MKGESSHFTHFIPSVGLVRVIFRSSRHKLYNVLSLFQFVREFPQIVSYWWIILPGSIQLPKSTIPESTFIYQKTLRKHMQGGIYMPCELLFYVCWIIKMYTCGKKRYTILKCDEQMIIELTIYVQIISCYCFIKSRIDRYFPGELT